MNVSRTRLDTAEEGSLKELTFRLEHGRRSATAPDANLPGAGVVPRPGVALA